MTAERDYCDFPNDMVLACHSIIPFVDGMSLDNYLADEKTRYAVMRAYEILGRGSPASAGTYEDGQCGSRSGFARLCHVAAGNDACGPAKPVVARSRREPGGRNSDVNAPPCKGQKHDGSLLPVRTGIAWLALASYATSSRRQAGAAAAQRCTR